jgi:hypothetical protein
MSATDDPHKHAPGYRLVESTSVPPHFAEFVEALKAVGGAVSLGAGWEAVAVALGLSSADQVVGPVIFLADLGLAHHVVVDGRRMFALRARPFEVVEMDAAQPDNAAVDDAYVASFAGPSEAGS